MKYETYRHAGLATRFHLNFYQFGRTTQKVRHDANVETLSRSAFCIYRRAEVNMHQSFGSM